MQRGFNFWLIGTILFLVITSGMLASIDWQNGWSELGGFNDIFFTSEYSPDTKQSKIEKARVSRVVDGDTVELSDGRKIRYLNVDTPETVKPDTPVKCFGPEAKKKNQELVENKEVWMTFDKEKQDRYGRDLRYLYTNQKDAEDQNVAKSINSFLVRNGYGRAVSYSPNTTFKKVFEEWMAQAQTNKSGLWAKCKNSF
jgi:micrococcal nuclease